MALPPISQIVEGFNFIFPPPVPVVQTIPVVRIERHLRYGSVFDQDDLALFLERQGRPVGAFSVTFTLFQLDGPALLQVGPNNRVPAIESLGRYYVTGTVGEGGQPGIWMIRWYIQTAFGQPRLERDFYFEVMASGAPPFVTQVNVNRPAMPQVWRQPPLPTEPPRPPEQRPKPHPIFQWGHVFGEGNLEIQLHDPSGNAVDPASVTFTLYMVEGQDLHRIGPNHRKPVRADVGRYYITGVAGEDGQPGEWLIVWSYQTAPGGPTHRHEQQFHVLAGPRNERGRRGWS